MENDHKSIIEHVPNRLFLPFFVPSVSEELLFRSEIFPEVERLEVMGIPQTEATELELRVREGRNAQKGKKEGREAVNELNIDVKQKHS